MIVAKLDRFARTLVGALSTLEEFERHDAVLVSVAENLDLSTPMGKAFLRILLVFAELERDRISESWKPPPRNAVARGIHIAKFTPIGYDKGADKRLSPNAEAPAIREAFLMRGAHKSRTEIARRARPAGARARTAGRWTPPMVERIIKNRVYLGEAYRGERVNDDAHPAIVTAAEWQAANLAPVRAAARSRQPNLLGGIARCAGCRYVLAPQLSRCDRARSSPATAAARSTPPASARSPRASPRAQARALRGDRLARADGPAGARGQAGHRRAPGGRGGAHRRPKRSWQHSRPT